MNVWLIWNYFLFCGYGNFNSASWPHLKSYQCLEGPLHYAWSHSLKPATSKQTVKLETFYFDLSVPQVLVNQVVLNWLILFCNINSSLIALWWDKPSSWVHTQPSLNARCCMLSSQFVTHCEQLRINLELDKSNPVCQRMAKTLGKSLFSLQTIYQQDKNMALV